MPHRDPRCVHFARTMSEAVITVSTLVMHGIPARVIDEMTGGGLGGLTVFGSDTAGGIAVWVDDPAQADEARELLLEMKDQIIERSTRKESGPLLVVCDKCGKEHEYEGAYRGTVQECPSCGHFLDIGEVEESMDWNTAEIDENDPELQ